jgi:hypothetical protein
VGVAGDHTSGAEAMGDEEWAVIAGEIAEEAAAAVSAPFAAHTYDAVRADLLAEGGLGGGLLRGEAEDGMGLGYDGQVDGLRREMGGDGVGDADAGGALAGVDRLVFSQLKPTFSPGRAGGGRGVL